VLRRRWVGGARRVMAMSQTVVKQRTDPESGLLRAVQVRAPWPRAVCASLRGMALACGHGERSSPQAGPGGVALAWLRRALFQAGLSQTPPLASFAFFSFPHFHSNVGRSPTTWTSWRRCPAAPRPTWSSAPPQVLGAVCKGGWVGAWVGGGELQCSHGGGHGGCLPCCTVGMGNLRIWRKGHSRPGRPTCLRSPPHGQPPHPTLAAAPQVPRGRLTRRSGSTALWARCTWIWTMASWRWACGTRVERWSQWISRQPRAGTGG
jgi:hypothetical protein